MRGVVIDRTRNFKKASKTNNSWVPWIILCALLCSISKTENFCHLFWLSSMAVQSTLICERLHQFQFWTSLDFHQKLRCILYTFYNKKGHNKKTKVMTSILTLSKIFINPLPRRFSKMLTRIPENTKQHGSTKYTYMRKAASVSVLNIIGFSPKIKMHTIYIL